MTADTPTVIRVVALIALGLLVSWVVTRILSRETSGLLRWVLRAVAFILSYFLLMGMLVAIGWDDNWSAILRQATTGMVEFTARSISVWETGRVPR